MPDFAFDRLLSLPDFVPAQHARYVSGDDAVIFGGPIKYTVFPDLHVHHRRHVDELRALPADAEFQKACAKFSKRDQISNY